MLGMTVATGQYVRPRMLFYIWTASQERIHPEAPVLPRLDIRGRAFGSQPDVGSVSHKPTMGRLRPRFTDVTGFGAFLASTRPWGSTGHAHSGLWWHH